MQAEYNRGTGFVISPLSVPAAAGKDKNKVKLPRIKWSFSIGGYFSHILSFILQERHFVKKVILKTTASLLLATGCVFFFCHFFTIGSAIYIGNDLVTYAFSEEEYMSALSSATEFAEEKGYDDTLLDFKMVPAFTLRKNVADSALLRDKLLESTGEFRYGCTLFSGNRPIFTAENEEIAKEVVKNYISAYAMDGQADIDAEISYKASLAPVSGISNKEKCLSLLSESGNIPVVSIVSTEQKKEIPYETQTEYDNDLYIGESVTVSEGKVGSLVIESQTIYKNGEFESSRILEEKVSSAPITQIIRVGTKTKDVLKSGLWYPLSGTLSSPFGERWGRMHEGIDIAVPIGTSVKAAECGVVIFAGNGGSYGNLVKIDHGNGVVTAYAHLDSICVSKGQAVNSDTEIAKSGNTGRSTGPHLHFEVVKDGAPLNPDKYLKKR